MEISCPFFILSRLYRMKLHVSTVLKTQCHASFFLLHCPKLEEVQHSRALDVLLEHTTDRHDPHFGRELFEVCTPSGSNCT